MSSIGHNGGPALVAGLSLDEAQELADVSLRPSHVQRYAGKGAPLRPIVGVGGLGPIGRAVLLACGHWREIRDFDLMPLLGRARPEAARCGCCRLNYAPDAADLAKATELVASESNRR